MKTVTLHRTGTGDCIAGPLEVAQTEWQRMVGLLGRDDLPRGRGMVLEDCFAIHTFFMRFAIDVIYVDRAMRVRKVIQGLKPWRMSASLGAAAVIELGAGTLDGSDVATGDALELRPT
jgi:uncharacterized membrane protein (UPF0127 family)